MPVFRIRATDEVVGCIVARSKEVATAYALGKYGAGTDVEKVSVKGALEVSGVCVLIETRLKEVGGMSSSARNVRVIS